MDEVEPSCKHCHYKEWNLFATEIVNVCSIQAHRSVVCWVFKVGDIHCSNHCVEDLCAWEEDECCQDRNWVVSKQICKAKCALHLSIKEICSSVWLCCIDSRAWNNNHHVDWEATKVTGRFSLTARQHHWKRKVSEAIHIQREKTSNLDIGLSINPILTPILNSPNSFSLSRFSCSFPSVANG